MLTKSFNLSLLAMAALVASAVYAQNYPSRPIRIVTSEVGGGNDFAARFIAQGLTNTFGQPVIVDNRPAVLSAEIASKAQPDGYTLLFSAGILWIGPLVQKTSYDPVKDFSAITSVSSAPNILVVHPSLPAKSVQELITLAKARPGELNYASAGAGAPSHTAMELFKSMASVNVVRIPYKGAGLALTAVIGGEAQLMFPTAGSVTPHLRSGGLRALAVTSAQPSALAPGLPTVAASGLPGYEATIVNGFFAPAKTPEAIIHRLNQEIVRFVGQPDVKQKFFDSGLDTIGSTSEEFARKIKSEMTRLGKVIKDAGIKAE